MIILLPFVLKLMNEGVIYRENNSTMNYAIPVVWKDNTAIILKSMGSRACIEKCYNSLFGNLNNGQGLHMDVVNNLTMKAFSTISNSIACVSTFSHNSMVHMQNKGVDMFYIQILHSFKLKQ